jgi:hypothetical protein
MPRSLTSRGAAVIVAAALFIAGASAPAAWADGDPASDVLAAQDVYYPYQPKVSPVLRDQLGALLRRVRADGLKVKVALIAGESDLGTQTKRFDKPRSYAELLGVELEITSVHDFVLVAMPAGLATYRYDERGLPALRKALAGVRGAGVADTDALARAAARGLIAMASATGHAPPVELAAPFVEPPARSGSDGNGGLVPALVVLAWLATIATAFGLRVSRARALASALAGSGSERAAQPVRRLQA